MREEPDGRIFSISSYTLTSQSMRPSRPRKSKKTKWFSSFRRIFADKSESSTKRTSETNGPDAHRAIVDVNRNNSSQVYVGRCSPIFARSSQNNKLQTLRTNVLLLTTLLQLIAQFICLCPFVETGGICHRLIGAVRDHQYRLRDHQCGCRSGNRFKKGNQFKREKGY